MSGAKFAWDAPEYQRPDKVGATKPSDYQAFDQTGLVKQMMSQLGGSQGIQQAQAAGRASKLGVGRSSGTVGQMEGIAADTQNRMQQARMGAAKESFAQQLAQQQFNDQMANDRYKTDLGMYEAEKSKRKQMLGPLGMFVN